MRRLSKSHLLVLGAFLAAGAAALPALAVRAGGRSRAAAFPRRPLLRRRLRLQPPEQRRRDRLRRPAGCLPQPHVHRQRGGRRRHDGRLALGGQSTCGDVGDASAYWVPTLYAGRRALRPLVSVGYYVRRTSGPVQAFPAGLKMIAGDAKARRPQPLSVVGWACGGFGATPRSAAVPACPPDRSLHMRATFPNCWNGRDLDSADHKRHLAYASAGVSALAPGRAAEPRPDLPLPVDRETVARCRHRAASARMPTSSTAGIRTRWNALVAALN